MRYLISICVGYLLGSINFSVFFSTTFFGRDVRLFGSGNAGATNMARIYGIGSGLLTLLGDMIKGAAAMFIGYKLLGETGLALGGGAVMLGHCYPVFHHFRGGKGVSIGAIVALAVDWKVFLAVIGAFLLAAFLSKKVSLGSVCGAVSGLIAALVFGLPLPKLLLTIFCSIMILVRHSENIRRLIAGTEPDFRQGKRKEKLPHSNKVAE